jgi:hypothetical protein
LEFLQTVKPNKFVGTLSYYFTADGKKYLTQQKPTLKVYTVKEVEAEPEEQEEVQLNIKPSGPKSIRDFL